MKPGYKQTEVGVIPEEWEIRSMDSLTSLMTNGFVGTATSAYVSGDDGVLYIQGYNVQAGDFDFHGIKRVSKAFHAKHQKSSLREGDLLTIQTGDIGVTTIVPKELVGANCHALVISRFVPRFSDPRFYCHYFNSERGKSKFKEIETGTTMKHLNVGDMKPLLLPAPPLPEQRAIAAALSEVDALLAALDRLIAKKRDLKQAAMQQLLTGQTRLPGFEGEWVVKSVRELGVIQTGPFGTLLKANEYSGNEGVPLISVGEIGAGKLRVSNHTPRVPKNVIRRLPQYVLRTGDIVFGRKGAVDRSALITAAENGWFLGSDGIRLRPHDWSHPPFLAWQFQRSEVQAWLLQNAIGTTMASLNQRILNCVEILYPPLPEQTAIAAVLSDMDAELAALEQRREKTRALKQGMMQELLTGRTRLV